MQNHTFTPGINRTVSVVNGDTYFVLYSTAIVVKYADGRIRLDTGGHYSSTTKRAMMQASNQFDLGFTVYAKKGIWFVHQPRCSINPKHDREFFDGMVLDNTPRELQ